MPNEFDADLEQTGKIVDFLTGQLLDPRPEEFVRQRYLKILHFEYNYPINVMAREVPVYHGSKELADAAGNPVRADIVVYRSVTACAQRDQGQIIFVVECKREKETEGYAQLVSYIYNTSAQGGVWYNGEEVSYFRRDSDAGNSLDPWTGIPRHNEAWDAVGRRKKADLLKPKDVRGLLRRCHNKLHGRGSDGEEEDLAMDMVRLILAKAQDEERPGALPEFYCTPAEYKTPEGQAVVAGRVQSLFRDAARLNSDVFSEHERIGVGDRAVADCVVELQNYQILSDLTSSADWDVMGHAYEQYTATYLKRQRGQFFTNRLVVDFMMDLLEPNYDDVVLDPAGGSGGFLTSALRHVRGKVLSGSGGDMGKARQLDKFRGRLFLVEISRRLVKVAKISMILNGDGHAGMTRGDSLGPYADLDKTVVANCGQGKPTIIATNPPFAGVGEGRIREAAVLERFDAGRRWAGEGDAYLPTQELVPDGAPPELLFFERVLDWTAPGGRVGIVMPKSFLDTARYKPARALLFRKAQVLAVINCHKSTFQPYTGVRTCLVFFRKLAAGEAPDPQALIFMALSTRIGQDSEGVPIFTTDASGDYTDEVDHDLVEILADYRSMRSGNFTPSETRFSVEASEIDADFRINPQLFLPALNETIRKLEEVDGVDGWFVTSLGHSAAGIAIFKGPRLKSENIIVASREASPGAEPYYTPSAVLQEKADSVKWLDASRASASQARTIRAIRVKRGDIVVTRSGSIGRVAMVTSRLDKAIVSDDLIRVRIPEEKLRFYVYAFLQSSAGQDQMLRNEYGSVQQHLEPEHVRDILVPVPEDWEAVKDVIATARQHFQYREAVEQAGAATAALVGEVLAKLMKPRETSADDEDPVDLVDVEGAENGDSRAGGEMGAER